MPPVSPHTVAAEFTVEVETRKGPQRWTVRVEADLGTLAAGELGRRAVLNKGGRSVVAGGAVRCLRLSRPDGGKVNPS